MSATCSLELKICVQEHNQYRGAIRHKLPGNGKRMIRTKTSLRVLPGDIMSEECAEVRL